ncbi:MAG: STAS domain-containing protein [Lachnospiraceae bacterium]|nr:STAS domain-containing protein [Lachnospiraceae bacterium]
MKFTKKSDGGELTIALSGELNILAAPELEAMINDSVKDAASLVLDFAECDYVSSAGIRVLLATFKSMKADGKSMALVHVGENFMEVLENTCLDAVFDIW